MRRPIVYRINNPKVIHETIDGETVLVNLDSGNYYSLDGVGADVWNLIEDGADQDGIVRAVARRYTGEDTAIEHAIHLFLEDLEREALIVVDNKSETGEEERPEDNGATEVAGKPFVAPALNKYTDMQDLLLLDPIHDVDEAGWPHKNVDKA